jgi:hypothetical protein
MEKHNNPFTEEEKKKCSFRYYKSINDKNSGAIENSNGDLVVFDYGVHFDRLFSEADNTLSLQAWSSKYQRSPLPENSTGHFFEINYDWDCQKYWDMERLDRSKAYKITFVYVRKDNREVKYSYNIRAKEYLFHEQIRSWDKNYPWNVYESHFNKDISVATLVTLKPVYWDGCPGGICTKTGYWYGTYQPGTDRSHYWEVDYYQPSIHTLPSRP